MAGLMSAKRPRTLRVLARGSYRSKLGQYLWFFARNCLHVYTINVTVTHPLYVYYDAAFLNQFINCRCPEKKCDTMSESDSEKESLLGH